MLMRLVAAAARYVQLPVSPQGPLFTQQPTSPAEGQCPSVNPPGGVGASEAVHWIIMPAAATVLYEKIPASQLPTGPPELLLVEPPPSFAPPLEPEEVVPPLLEELLEPSSASPPSAGAPLELEQPSPANPRARAPTVASAVVENRKARRGERWFMLPRVCVRRVRWNPHKSERATPLGGPPALALLRAVRGP
jgi:hypothetical protein